MKNLIIRPLRKNETDILKELLYQAVFQLPEKEPYPRDIIYIPEIYSYIKEFGRPDDICLVTETDSRIIGGIWTRIPEYNPGQFGYIDRETPELVIPLLPEYRNKGIGTQLLQKMIQTLKEQNYKQVSLKVETLNYAVNLYKKAGFIIINEQEPDYLMLLNLNNRI